MTNTSAEAPKAQKDRSPSYPFIPLRTAVERTAALERTFGRHPAPLNKAGLAWQLKETSSQAAQTLAALKSFGLVEYQGPTSDRAAALTDDARMYFRAQQESIRAEVLKRLALKPKAIEKYWNIWGSDRPPEPVCLDQLVLKDGFTQSAAQTFLRVYDDTISYAGLSDSDSDLSEKEPSLDGDVEVGDLVQVELDGVLQLPKPARVRAIQDHQGAQWVFVEGSEAGVLMENVVLEERGAPRGRSVGAGITPPILPLEGNRQQREAQDGWHEERLLDDQNEEIFLTYKGEPSVARYEFIRDYLIFRIQRQQKIEAAKPKTESDREG